jgi:hypothetical protein
MAVKEVVVYTVHEHALAGLASASASMDAFLATQAGYVRRAVHADAKTPNRFMDIVEWNSLQEAELAASAVESEPSVVVFLQAIASIDMMSHFVAQS